VHARNLVIPREEKRLNKTNYKTFKPYNLKPYRLVNEKSEKKTQKKTLFLLETSQISNCIFLLKFEINGCNACTYMCNGRYRSDLYVSLKEIQSSIFF